MAIIKDVGGSMAVIKTEGKYVPDFMKRQNTRQKFKDIHSRLEGLSPLAIAELERQMLKSPSEKIRQDAAIEILDRAGYVKVEKRVQLTANAESIIKELNKLSRAQETPAIEISAEAVPLLEVAASSLRKHAQSTEGSRGAASAPGQAVRKRGRPPKRLSNAHGAEALPGDAGNAGLHAPDSDAPECRGGEHSREYDALAPRSVGDDSGWSHLYPGSGEHEAAHQDISDATILEGAEPRVAGEQITTSSEEPANDGELADVLPSSLADDVP